MSAINVNLAPCRCPVPVGSAQHWEEQCAAKPLLLPCPIPPSFTAKVVLGACLKSECYTAHGDFSRTVHRHDCPARPVAVSCSTSGSTWEESEVTEIETVGPTGKPREVIAAAHARWALAKALVLGHDDLSALLTGPMAVDLLTQRDAVFAALVRIERGHLETMGGVNDINTIMRRPAFGLAPSAVAVGMLEDYVERLIERVGVIEVAS